MSIAQTILSQLGGNRFVLMTGAKNMLNTGSGLQFDLPTTRDFVKNGANKVRVTLADNDTYTVEFFKWNSRKLELAPIAKHEGIYFDMLRPLFTRETGLDTRL